MEGTGWHYSHLKDKQDFGYQVFGANISTGDFSLCYCLRRCSAQDYAAMLPNGPHRLDRNSGKYLYPINLVFYQVRK